MTPTRNRQRPTTLQELYRTMTGDQAPTPQQLAARFRQLTARQKRIIRARMQGTPLQAIAKQEGGISHVSVYQAIDRALQAMRKAIAGEPRYNVIGRSKAA